MAERLGRGRGEDDYRAVLEDFAQASGGWLWQTDADHRFTYMSDSVRAITGVTPEWHYGQSRRDFGVPEAVSPEEWQAHLDTLDRHEPFDGFVFRRRGPDGEKWMRTSGRPYFDADGRFLGYRGVAMDVTVQVEAERTIGMLRGAIEQLAEPFVLWGPDDRLVTSNRRFREINRFAPDLTRPGTPFEEHIRGVARHEASLGNIDDAEAWVTERLRRHREAGEPFELRRDNGVWLLLQEQRMSDGSTVTVTTDIAAVKRAQVEADEARRRLVDAIEALQDGFCLFDPDDRIVLFNSEYAAFYEALGAPIRIGQTFEDLTRVVMDRGLIAEAVGREDLFCSDAVDRHKNPDRPSELRLVDGRWFRIQETRTADGGIVRFRADITEVKARQKELEEARRQAEAATAAKSSFLANMSHEIRTPLNGIVGFGRLLAATPVSGDQADYLKRILQSSEQLHSIVNDILDFSKIESGHMRLENVPFDLMETVRRVIDMADPKIHDKRIALRLIADPGVPTHVTGDPLRVAQILGNLCSNAVKFTEQGEVTVRLRSEPAQAGRAVFHFSVADTGIGMSREQLARIFQPFTQADASTTRRFGGTGLGLSICRHLTGLMDGEIWAESKEGAGSVFHFRILLDIANHSAGPQRDNAGGGDNPAGDEAAIRGMRVLLVEDNEINQDLAVAVLRQFGAVVAIANNGRRAVERIVADGAAAFDAVLMDVQMPEMDGLTATRLLRALPACRDLPIIAMTAHVMQADVGMCLAAGMSDHLGKPLDHIEVCSVLARWRKRPGGTARRREASAPETQGPAVPAVSLVQALAELLPNEAAAGRILHEFARSQPATVSELGRAVANGDWANARRLAHQVKGMTANLRMRELAAAAGGLEALLDRSDPSALELTAAMRTVDDAFAEVLGRIAVELPGETAENPPGVSLSAD